MDFGIELADLLILRSVLLISLGDVSISFLDLSFGQLVCIVLLPDGTSDPEQALLVVRLVFENLLALVDDLVILLRLQLAVSDVRPTGQLEFAPFRF